MADWLDFLFDIASWVFATVAVFEGTRQLALGRPRWPALGFVGAGIIWCVLNTATAFYVSLSMDVLKVSDPNQKVVELAPDWGSNLNPEERNTSSRAYAQVVYSSTGRLVEHFDRAGTRSLFTPTQEEHREREYAVVLQEEMETLAHESFTWGFRWSISGVLALAIGFVVGRRERKLAANPSFKRDAPKRAP